MIVNLEHPEISWLFRQGAFEILKNVDKFSKFKGMIEIVASKYEDLGYLEKVLAYNNKLSVIDIDESDEGSKNLSKEDYAKFKLKGDLFEIFCEFYLRSEQSFNIKKMIIEHADKDYGVDFYGTLVNDEPFTVQVKYRKNIVHKLNHNEIKQFPWLSYKRYKVTNTNNMLLLASCNEIDSWSNNNMYDSLFTNRSSSGGNFIRYEQFNKFLKPIFFQNFYKSLESKTYS